MAGKLDSFARGVLQGYTSMKTAMNQQAEHDARMEEVARKKALNDGLLAIESNVTPMKGFSVAGPEGSQFFADEKMATEAAKAIPDAMVQEQYVVAGKPYANELQAKDAASRENSDGGKMRRRMELAMQHGEPALAQQYGQAYGTITKANKDEAFGALQQAMSVGDTAAIGKLLSDRPGSRGQVQVVETGDGGLALQTTGSDGKTYMGDRFNGPNELYAALQRQITDTPDNVFERSMLAKRAGLDERRMDETIRHNQASEGTAAASVGIAGGQLGLAQKRFDAEQAAPKGITSLQGIDNSGGQTVSGAYWTKDPKTGDYRQVVSQAQATGAKPNTKPVSPLDQMIADSMAGRGAAATPTLSFDGGALPPRTAPAAPMAATPTPRVGLPTSPLPAAEAPATPAAGGLLGRMGDMWNNRPGTVGLPPPRR